MFLLINSPPPRQTCWLLLAFLSLFQRRRSSRCRLLTEEEYREQAQRHTKASLEELRRYCTKPGFPAWDTVLRLRAPQRYRPYTPHRCQTLRSDWSGGFASLTTDRFCLVTHRFAEFLRNGVHITPSELQGHERYHAFRAENDEHTLLHSTHTTAASEDFSDDEISTQTRPPLSPSPFASLPALPAVPALPALPPPPAYTAPACPYPLTPFSPAPERPLTDDDEPF